MIKKAHAFINDEEGAVTVDWVVLTAAIIIVTISAYLAIQDGSNEMADAVGVFLIETDHDQLRNPNQ
ncbi:hypothetical protein OS189_14735 [Sulfitobacter sp. F26169L]|nr:hypothetical protein [Sulfitobacter sp. F26169L]